MKQIFKNWSRFCHKVKFENNQKLLQEQRRVVLNEISEESAEKIQRWMRGAGVYDYSFDDLFDNKMRIAMPLDTDDSRNLKKVISVIAREGYGIPDRAAGFNRRRVKQKLRRLVTGEEYEIEITVADIEFEKKYSFEIPAGPRKGETIEKTDKRNMAKLMQKLIKEKKIDPDLMGWWQKRQTYYTKDRNYEEIEALITGDTKEYMIIISRHPIDVLRMSDIGNITSCHSEGESYFKCAEAEAKGHGPIAYLVEKKDYQDLLAGMYSEYDTADDPESAFDVSEKFAKQKAEEFIRKYAIRHAKFYSSLVKQLDNHELFEFGVDAIKDHPRVKRNFNDLPSTAKDQLTYQAFHDAVTAAQKGQEWSLVTGDEHEAEDLREIGDFDTKEIWKDSDRIIKGIVAPSRVRIRKFYDQATDHTFAVPELTTYGPHPPGFVEAVRKWTWEEQKYMFIDEGAAEEDQELQTPRSQDLIRYGGSYEDNKDGAVLNAFFKEAGEEKFTRGMGYEPMRNVAHELGDEGPDLYQEYQDRVDELNAMATNTLEHFYTSAGVDEYEVGHPYVMGNATLVMEFPLNWKEDPKHDERKKEYIETDNVDALSIPEWMWRYPNQQASALMKVLRDSLTGPKKRMYHNYSIGQWQVVDNRSGAGERLGHKSLWNLRVTFEIDFEPDDPGPDQFEMFITDLQEFEKYYDETYERMRRALVSGWYIAPNAWDDTEEERLDIEDELNNFIVVGEDEDEPDGVVMFTLMGKGIDEGPDSEISTKIRFPISKIPRKLDVGDFRMNYLIPNVLGGGQPRKSDRRFVAGGDEWRGQKLEATEIDIDGSQFKTEFLKHLKQLEEEANGYAKNQLELAFGDKYKRPAFKGINFAEDTVIRIRLVGPTGEWSQEIGVSYIEDPILTYSFRIYARQQHSREELAGTFKFVRFVDKHVDMIHKAMQQAATKMFDRAIGETQAEHEARYDGEVAMQLISSIQTDPSMRELPGAMAVIDFIRKNWPEMDVIERLTVVEQYLEPMDRGSTRTIYDGEGYYTLSDDGDEGVFTNTPGYPYRWFWEVTRTRKAYGAPWAVDRGSPFYYKPKLRALDREDMELPRKEEELTQQAKEVSGMFEQCAPARPRRGIRIKIK